MSFNTGYDGRTMVQLLRKLNLLDYDYFCGKLNLLQELEKCNLDLGSNETIQSQYTNFLINSIHTGLNKSKSSAEIWSNLENTLSYHDILEVDFDSSVNKFQQLIESLNKILSTKDCRPLPQSSTDGEDISPDVSSKLSDIICLSEGMKDLIKEAGNSNKQLKLLQSKLENFKELPPDSDAIKQKILEAHRTIEALEKDMFEECQ